MLSFLYMMFQESLVLPSTVLLLPSFCPPSHKPGMTKEKQWEQGRREGCRRTGNKEQVEVGGSQVNRWQESWAWHCSWHISREVMSWTVVSR